MKRNDILLVTGALLAVFAGASQAAELSPELQVGSRGIVSLDAGRTDSGGEETYLNYSDTTLLVGFRQKLYGTLRARMALGLEFPEAGSELGPVFFHQMIFKVEDETNVVRVGRTRFRSALVEFPTARDDDALMFSDTLNPMFYGDDSENTQYAEVVEYGHVFAQRFWVRGFAAHLRERGDAGTDAAWRVNAAGGQLEYRVPETQRWNRNVLAQAGVGYTAYLKRSYGDDDPSGTLNNLQGSLVLNVVPDPVHFVDVRLQGTLNLGLAAVDTLAGGADLAASRRLSALVSVRYLYRKLERPELQAALLYGHTRTLEPAVAGSAHLLMLNLFWRIGENFDLGVQGAWRHAGGAMGSLLGRDDALGQILLVYNIDESWNDQFDDRDSLLNLEHGYIP